jgi:monothiol glutaredoxin
MRRSFPTAMTVCFNAFGKRMFRSSPTILSSDKDFEPKRVVPPTFDEVKTKLEELVRNNKVVLFMKGSPSAPQCGFSRQVVQILAQEGLTDYIYVDVLKSDVIRDSVKKFSDWPTIPQLYVGGEFIGGCDITKEMHAAGELKGLLKSAGVELGTNTSE